MGTVLSVIQILISLALIVVIMMQSKGAGLGRMFGGGDAPAITKTRRGLEKTLFQITVGLSVAFLVVALLSVLLFG